MPLATVLVVDDEPDICLLTQMTLEQEGYEVEVATGGAAALQAIDRARPDLVVLDVMMPGVDGWAVLAGLKADPDPARREVPVVLLTALDGPLDRARGGIEGAVRYLTKPIDLDDLCAAVADGLACSEPDRRRQAQHQGLELLARLEGGELGVGDTFDRPTVDAPPRLRLSGLERVGADGRERRQPERVDERPARTSVHEAMAGCAEAEPGETGDLTDKQLALLDTVSQSSTVIEAAQRLGMSRSNVYASLRRISRRLGVHSVPELLDDLRAGDPAPRNA